VPAYFFNVVARLTCSLRPTVQMRKSAGRNGPDEISALDVDSGRYDNRPQSLQPRVVTRGILRRQTPSPSMPQVTRHHYSVTTFKCFWPNIFYH